MITKERLEELIEQGATIYSNEYGEIQLKKENDLSLYENGQNNYILYALEPNKKYHNEIFDEDLFETEEEAKATNRAKVSAELEKQIAEKRKEKLYPIPMPT